MTRMTKRTLLVAAGGGLAVAVLRPARLSAQPALAADPVVLADKA